LGENEEFQPNSISKRKKKMFASCEEFKENQVMHSCHSAFYSTDKQTRMTQIDDLFIYNISETSFLS